MKFVDYLAMNNAVAVFLTNNTVFPESERSPSFSRTPYHCEPLGPYTTQECDKPVDGPDSNHLGPMFH